MASIWPYQTAGSPRVGVSSRTARMGDTEHRSVHHREKRARNTPVRTSKPAYLWRAGDRGRTGDRGQRPGRRAPLSGDHASDLGRHLLRSRRRGSRRSRGSAPSTTSAATRSVSPSGASSTSAWSSVGLASGACRTSLASAGGERMRFEARERRRQAVLRCANIRRQALDTAATAPAGRKADSAARRVCFIGHLPEHAVPATLTSPIIPAWVTGVS
jgi:hypothetical protein